MSIYEYYQQQKDNCEQMAAIYVNDPALNNFYKNAAAGFEIKKNKLTVSEAEK